MEAKRNAKLVNGGNVDQLVGVSDLIKQKPELAKEDPIATDGDKYSVVLENERVRVLRYHDKPGDRTLQHAHPDYVLYAESSFKRRLTFPDGQSQEVDVKKGSSGWFKAHTHIGENIGDTDTDVVIVELK